MADGLLAFIAARLDDEEERGRHPGHYYSEDCWYSCPKAAESCGSARTGSDECDCNADKRGAEVLARVAALRALVALHQPEDTEYIDGDGIERGSVDCATCDHGGTSYTWPCDTIRHIAAIWAGHDDYHTTGVIHAPG